MQSQLLTMCVCHRSVLRFIRPTQSSQREKLPPDEIDHLGAIRTDVLTKVEVHVGVAKEEMHQPREVNILLTLMNELGHKIN